MKAQNFCSGFIINFYGDRSVGIFDQEWTINGEFHFESKDDIETFKKKIIEAFEYASDTPLGIESIEERMERIEIEGF